MAALITAALTASAATAQPADKYPDRPIKIIVPFAPGGSTDILARVIAQKMLDNWGQQVIVETRPGAATVIGTAAAAQAPPDGYTLLMTVSNLATNPALHDTLPYDALKDFDPVSLLGRAPIVPYVHPEVSAQDHQGADRVRQDQSGAVRLRRRRQHDASRRGDAQGSDTASV